MISDASGSSPGHDPNPDWPDIQREYETSRISHRALAKKRNVSYGTLSKRAMRQHWCQKAKIIRKAVNQLESERPSTMLAAAKNELAPWIEQKKDEFTREGFTVANHGVERIKTLFKANKKPDAKSESFIAKAFETYHRAGRTALGMTDGTSPAGAINLNIMANQAAVQIAPVQSQD